MENKINIEVAFADENQQAIISLQVKPDCTVDEAIQQSHILQQFPKIDLTINKVGIFGKQVTLDTTLQMGDRVEIYRALLIDPKQARLLRARKQKLKN